MSSTEIIEQNEFPRLLSLVGVCHSGGLIFGQCGCTSYSLAQQQIKSNSDIPVPEAPPWVAWQLVAPPNKHCGMPIHLRHRQQRTQQLIISALCGQWNCSVCGPFLKQKWFSHLTPKIMDAMTVHLSILSRREWPTAYRRIRRVGGEFAKIELNDGPLVIFTTANVGVSLPASIRSGVIKAAIDAATFKHRAVSTSRGWALPKNTDPSEWERVGALPGTIDDARQAIKKLGLEPQELSPEYLRGMNGVNEGFDVNLPNSWLDDNERGYHIFVQWLRNETINVRDGPMD